jgi:DNA-binding response OmpR family regulator
MKKILVIDDQPYLQELISEEFKSSRYEIDTISDISSLREYFETSIPDLVLLDLYLDGFQGWHALGDIKIRFPHLPVLIVTAYDSYINDPRLEQADGYVVKNSDLTVLRQKIENLIEENKK